MPKMKFLSFVKILALLLLASCSVVAKNGNAANEFQQHQSLKLNKTADNLHKNMLQPQVVHVSILTEHPVKPIASGLGILFIGFQSHLLLQPTLLANEILQDADRCESVSKFLFPYHFFW